MKGSSSSRDERRPFLAKEEDSLPRAEKWRREVIRETGKKVAAIQNAGLGEERLRDLNDEINKLLRERGHWELRIKQLGGPDYQVSAPKQYDGEGRELPGTGGYKYFGAAKELPGVRELFQAEKPKPPKRTRGDMNKGIRPSYYGAADEDDGVLIAAEASAETKLRQAEINRWKRQRGDQRKLRVAKGLAADEPEEDLGLDILSGRAAKDGVAAKDGGGGGGGDDGGGDGDGDDDEGFRSFVVNVPSQEEVQAMLLERKKQEMLARFAAAAGGQS